MIALMRVLNTKTHKGRDEKEKTAIHQGVRGFLEFRKSFLAVDMYAARSVCVCTKEMDPHLYIASP